MDSSKSTSTALSLSELVQLLRDKQTTLTDDQRLSLWSDIRADFCEHCGSRIVGRKCYCLADD